MAAITLLDVFLHSADDLSDFLALANCSSLEEDSGGPSDVRLYASGRTRRTRMRGVVTTVAMTLERCTRAEVDQLRAWQDHYLLLRDPRGRVLYGAYSAKQLHVTEYAAIDAADVTIRFDAVTPPDILPAGSGEA